MKRGGVETFLQLSRLLCIMTLLFAACAAHASPTIISLNHTTTTSPSPTDTTVAICRTVNNTVAPANSQLAGLARELLQPPTSATLSNTAPNVATALPAAPAAVVMGIVGFLCVSFVRDRRTWLAVIAALASAGQTGLQAIPHLALRITCRNHNTHLQTAALPAHRHYFKHPSRLRSDLEGTQYIGLLHYLGGIPNLKSDYANRSLNCLIGFGRQLRNRSSRACEYRTKTFAHRLAAILTRCILNPLTGCPAKRADYYILFSPATIFQIIPRGPPCLT